MDQKSSPERLSIFSDGVFRRMMRMRSMVTLVVFAIASLLSLKLPLWGLGLCCACRALYVRPEAPVVTARAG